MALLVLGVSIVLEFGSLMGCLREIKKLRKDARSLATGCETTRNAELVVVLGEDLAALFGLALAFVFVSLATVTGNPVFDAIGSIVIGVVLVCVSIFIAVRIKGLHRRTFGRRRPAGRLRAEVAADPDIAELLNAITLQMGPRGDAGDEGAHDARDHASKQAVDFDQRAGDAASRRSSPKSPGASSSPTSPTRWCRRGAGPTARSCRRRRPATRARPRCSRAPARGCDAGTCRTSR